MPPPRAGRGVVRVCGVCKTLNAYTAKAAGSLEKIFPLLGEGLRERVYLEGRRRYEGRPFGRRRTGCQEVKPLSVLRTEITSVTSLPSCHLTLRSSDNDPLPSPPPREGACHEWSDTLPCDNKTNSCKPQMADGTATFPLSLCEREQLLTSLRVIRDAGEGVIRCQEGKLLSVPGTKITSVTSLPSCHLTFRSSDCYPLPQSLPQGREAEKRASRFTLHSSLKKHAAFTLAEVLITLGIIGVVAAMTMPSLIANHREKQTVAQLKKAYSTIQQAYLMAINKYGDAESWSLSNTHIGDDDEGNAITDYSSAYTIFSYLAENMKAVDGGKANQYIRYEYDAYSLDGTFRNTISTNRDIPNIILADGTQIYSGWIEDGNMDIYVSLNKCSKKGKCTVGKDLFYFKLYFSPARIVPDGSYTVYPTRFKETCNIGKTNTENGRGCTAWVLQNENMDYLHCDDLDWNTKTRCK